MVKESCNSHYSAVKKSLYKPNDNGFCQKVKTVEGEYTYHVPENVSLAEAKRYALKQAQLNAIANEFGTVVERTNLTRVENSSKASETRFVSLGSSDVKGEWIGFIGKPVYSYSIEVCKSSGCGFW